jgi:hypothetical protein
VYGLTKNLETYNPVRIAFKEWGDMFRQAGRSGSIRKGINYLLRPPGWSHDGSGKTTKEMRNEELKMRNEKVESPINIEC